MQNQEYRKRVFRAQTLAVRNKQMPPNPRAAGLPRGQSNPPNPPQELTLTVEEWSRPHLLETAGKIAGGLVAKESDNDEVVNRALDIAEALYEEYDRREKEKAEKEKADQEERERIAAEKRATEWKEGAKDRFKAFIADLEELAEMDENDFAWGLYEDKVAKKTQSRKKCPEPPEESDYPLQKIDTLVEKIVEKLCNVCYGPRKITNKAKIGFLYDKYTEKLPVHDEERHRKFLEKQGEAEEFAEKRRQREKQKLEISEKIHGGAVDLAVVEDFIQFVISGKPFGDLDWIEEMEKIITNSANEKASAKIEAPEYIEAKSEIEKRAAPEMEGEVFFRDWFDDDEEGFDGSEDCKD